MATYNANQFKPGMKLMLDGDPCSLVSVEFVKPGKGQAFTRVKYKNLISKRAGLEKTFKANENIEAADVLESEYSFLYKDGNDYFFMDETTYEQIAIAGDIVADASNWLAEQDKCVVTTWDGRPIQVQPPNFVCLKIVDCNPGVRGNTVSGGSKPATLETGANVKVPLFVNQGEIVKIDTRNAEYVGRVKDDEQ